MSLAAVAILTEEVEHEVNHAVSWGIGALTLFILMFMLLGLVMFGGGRDHT